MSNIIFDTPNTLVEFSREASVFNDDGHWISAFTSHTYVYRVEDKLGEIPTVIIALWPGAAVDPPEKHLPTVMYYAGFCEATGDTFMEIEA